VQRLIDALASGLLGALVALAAIAVDRALDARRRRRGPLAAPCVCGRDPLIDPERGIVRCPRCKSTVEAKGASEAEAISVWNSAMQFGGEVRRYSAEFSIADPATADPEEKCRTCGGSCPRHLIRWCARCREARAISDQLWRKVNDAPILVDDPDLADPDPSTAERG
jgi:hypothetical protein